MATVLLYVVAFSTWGLGLIAFVSLIGINIERWNKKKELQDFEIKEKTMLLERLTNNSSQLSILEMMDNLGKKPNAAPSVPEKVKDFMSRSPEHPEVAEIDGYDEIVGVRFEAENYPPGFDLEEGDD